VRKRGQTTIFLENVVCPFFCAVSGDGYQGTLAALIAVAITVALIPVGHILLLKRMNFSAQTMSLITRFGGLLIATIGIQLVLDGIKSYFNL
jgi:multiple antibiotic resistance protein